jgi:hypothetical protein
MITMIIFVITNSSFTIIPCDIITITIFMMYDIVSPSFLSNLRPGFRPAQS